MIGRYTDESQILFICQTWISIRAEINSIRTTHFITDSRMLFDSIEYIVTHFKFLIVTVLGETFQLITGNGTNIHSMN